MPPPSAHDRPSCGARAMLRSTRMCKLQDGVGTSILRRLQPQVTKSWRTSPCPPDGLGHRKVSPEPTVHSVPHTGSPWACLCTLPPHLPRSQWCCNTGAQAARWAFQMFLQPEQPRTVLGKGRTQTWTTAAVAGSSLPPRWPPPPPCWHHPPLCAVL